MPVYISHQLIKFQAFQQMQFSKPSWAMDLRAGRPNPRSLRIWRKRRKKLGIWNIFLSNHYRTDAVGFSNLEYGLIAEQLGKSMVASKVRAGPLDLPELHWLIHSQVFNFNPSDTGNMEVLFKYGNEAQKEQWLAPLLAGDIRSVFLMTEPGVISSDAKNIRLKLKKDGDFWVLNGSICTTIGWPVCIVLKHI